MKKKHLIIGGIGVVVLSIAGYFVVNANSTYTTEDFAECLSSADIVMYGTDWCTHCADQKKMFGDAFSEINFVNCDFNPEECDAAGIQGYPTWKIGDELLGNPGVKTFLELATAGECNLPSEL